MSKVQQSILNVLESQRESQIATQRFDSFVVLLFVLAIVVNLTNLFHTQGKVINFMNGIGPCSRTQYSSWGLAIAIQQPLVAKLMYLNESTPLFMYYLINQYGDPTTGVCGRNACLLPSMVCSKTITPTKYDALTVSKESWADSINNPFYPMIPETSKIVDDALHKKGSQTLANLTTQNGFIEFAESNAHMSYTELWDYCFVDQQQKGKGPCHNDTEGFIGSIFSNGCSGAFLGGMQTKNPIGAVLGFIVGGVVGALTNQSKLQKCTK